ncbi:MAG TPA: ABC transporter ATP-binding protein [Verrucomicrobiae bacterium]
MARIVIEHLTKHFPVAGGPPVCAVRDLTFTVEPGEWLVLVGPSGCGKTTTLRLVAGLEEPTSGTIAVDGRCVNAVPARDREVAMVFQSPALYPHLSVFENMAFGLRIRHVPKQATLERVRVTAEMLGLEDCLQRKPMELSGGQRQRVAVGRALVRQPSLLLLDEPLSNLDPQIRAELRSELLALRERLRTTVLYVTHDQHEAMTLGTRLGVLRNGALQQIGTPRELYEHPTNQFVAGFLGSPPMNFLRGTLTSVSAGLVFRSTTQPPGTAPLELSLVNDSTLRMERWVNKEVMVGLRPEHISFAEPVAEERAQAPVEAVEDLGADRHVHLNVNGERIVARVPGSQPVRVRGKVAPRFDMRAALFFDVNTGMAIS